MRPTKTGHPTRSYCSNKFVAGCRLTLHIGNAIPRNYPYMTPYVPVNSSNNSRRSSANAFDDLFSHQCRGTLSRFGVVCTASANALDSRFLLRLELYQECTSDSCLKFSAHNCGWAVRIKLIGLACVADCANALRLLLLTLLVL